MKEIINWIQGFHLDYWEHLTLSLPSIVMTYVSIELNNTILDSRVYYDHDKQASNKILPYSNVSGQSGGIFMIITSCTYFILNLLCLNLLYFLINTCAFVL